MAYEFKTLEQQRAEANAQALKAAGQWEDPNTNRYKPGVLTETITRCDETGRKIRTYSGDKKVWMAPWQGPMQQQLSAPITTDQKPFFFYKEGGVKV